MCKIVVIMSTYNGENYIREQIESILNQEECEVMLYIRDDGSKDATVKIIDSYLDSGHVILKKGINLGAKNSFMKAISEAPRADYYALADQDDLWDSKKLYAAIKLIKESERNEDAVLYHSALNLCDKNGVIFAKTGKYNNIGFLNGETRAITGCTVVFNNKLMDLLRIHLPLSYPMHDAWIHNVCLAAGGKIIYDENSYIRYRQHDNNVVGGSRNIYASIKRRIAFLKKMEKNQTSKMYQEILDNYYSYMPENNIKKAEKLCAYNKSLSNKFYVLFKGDYFKGRLWWKMEKICMILLDRF